MIGYSSQFRCRRGDGIEIKVSAFNKDIDPNAARITSPSIGATVAEQYIVSRYDTVSQTGWAQLIEGTDDEYTVKEYRYSSSHIVVAPKGKGEAFCAGTIYWFLCLKWKDRTPQQITHNVLSRFTA
ncbi:hypothetical protein [Ruegeria sp. HKCCA0370]|uniref:hypothetical protein n=1 Tax=Ruegeria sp. HKCCA0370 TaxID=2682995 RepID=UPI001487DBEE|nr:hypothetical protein [Ruegeria sp. HKCCA0370]